MPKDDDRKRAAPISYRPPEELRAEFARRVQLSGLSANAFITQAVFAAEAPRQSRRPTANHQAVGQLLAELARVRDRLDEAARVPGGNSALIADAVTQLGEIRTACFMALGRKP